MAHVNIIQIQHKLRGYVMFTPVLEQFYEFEIEKENNYSEKSRDEKCDVR